MTRKIKSLLLMITAILTISVSFDNCGPLKIVAKKGLKSAFNKVSIKTAGKEGAILSGVFSGTKLYRKYGCNSLKEAIKKITSSSSKIKRATQTKTMLKCIKNSAIYKDLIGIEAKGAIRLSEKEMKELLENPNYLRTYIETYTGNSKNFQEFFIRLANGNKQQVKKILSNPELKTMVEKRIRSSNGGGNHEWLMCKNYMNFLTNPKWGEEGKYLSLAMTKLVQKTESVIFKYGGSHGGTNSTIFHNKLAKVIENCNTKEEMLVKIRKFAQKELSESSYNEFSTILKEILK